MKKGPIAAILVLGGVLLFAIAPIHAMVREANALFALGIVHRHGEDLGQADAVRDFADALPPIPSAMHWLCFAAGGVCIAAGVWVVWRGVRDLAAR